MKTKVVLLFALACGLATLPAWAPSYAEDKSDAAEKEAVENGIDAYVYGYPLVTMEITRRVMTNTAEPEGTHAPMGQFVRMRTYPDASFKDVTAPNADTLYTTGFIDVGKEPYVLSLPDANDRYYLFPMLDGWTDVFQVPGKRTTGTKAQTYLIAGPGWTGTPPAGAKPAEASSSSAWPGRNL